MNNARFVIGGCRREPRFGGGMMPPADLGQKLPPSEIGTSPVQCEIIVVDVDRRQR